MIGPVIEREMNILSADEIRKHKSAADKAKIAELMRWSNRKVFERIRRSQSSNCVTSRWVMKWKLIRGVREIKARLTVHGFKDRQRFDVKTFAATASRWSQRMICSICAQNNWTIWSMDVSQAFLRGKSFKELAKQTGQKERSLQFELPSDGVDLLRMIKGFESFDSVTEVLNMLKPGFGTNDAPWAWATVFHEDLIEFGFVPTQADGKL